MLSGIDIYADGANIKELETLNNSEISGFTFNPSLFRKNKALDFIEYSKEILNIIRTKPVSLEVISDDFYEMYDQALKLNKLAENVYVKIPITNTIGKSSVEVLKRLIEMNIKLNVTAVFTINQVAEIIETIKDSKSIISIFSGRIFDIGIDAVSHTKEISKFIRNNSNCKTLWASPRMVYDVINARNSNCDIITMNTSLIKKIELFNKKPEEYSLETVKMFYDDALKSNYKF